MSMFTCKECHVEKVRARGTKRRSEHRYKYDYVDEHGKRWNGHLCPQCFRVQTASTNTKSRRSVRMCRSCLKRLPSDRYFTCTGCTKYTPDYYDIFADYQQYEVSCG